jgi:hypothetical protein
MRHHRPPGFRDVVTDDDLSRLIHAMNARPGDVFHRQVSEDPGCDCCGPDWSCKILAEVWHEMPRSEPEIAPLVGWSDSAPPAGGPSRPGKIDR